MFRRAAEEFSTNVIDRGNDRATESNSRYLTIAVISRYVTRTTLRIITGDLSREESSSHSDASRLLYVRVSARFATLGVLGDSTDRKILNGGSLAPSDCSKRSRTPSIVNRLQTPRNIRKPKDLMIKAHSNILRRSFRENEVEL